MSGPDGLEQRTAAHREHFDAQPEDLDDADYDDDLLDIASDRIESLCEASV